MFERLSEGKIILLNCIAETEIESLKDKFGKFELSI